MSFDVLDLCAAHDVPVEGLVHVGANNAREYPAYHARTRGPLLYVEALPHLAEQVAATLDPARPHAVRQAVVADTRGAEVTFHVASNNGLSSSLLPPGRHAELYPEITFDTSLRLTTERLDDLVSERPEGDRYNVLLLDVQGAELQVLGGAPELLSRVDAVFAEVSSEPLYDGGCTFAEVTSLLDDHGLVFRAARRGWGDAFYSRTHGTLRRLLTQNLALGRPTRQSSHLAGPSAPSAALDADLPDQFGVHTADDDPAPFWEVDLGVVRPITRLLYLDRRGRLRRAASLVISTSVDGERYDVVHRRDPERLGNLLDVAVDVEARFVRLALEDGGPLHFRSLVVL